MADASPGGAGAGGRRETEPQRWDRNFTDLLQELRVAQTGVQILFGFLLTVPFSNRFGQVTTLQKVVYALTFLSCTVAAALLIAPVSRHRQMFRQGRKAELVMRSDLLAQSGLLALMVTVTGVVFLVMDVLAGLAAACPLAVSVACVYYWLWYYPARTPVARWGEEEDRIEADERSTGRE